MWQAVANSNAKRINWRTCDIQENTPWPQYSEQIYGKTVREMQFVTAIH